MFLQSFDVLEQVRFLDDIDLCKLKSEISLLELNHSSCFFFQKQRTPRNQLDLDNDSRIIIRSVRNAVRPMENNFTDSDRHLYSTTQRNESFRSIPNQSSIGSDDMKKGHREHRSLRKVKSRRLFNGIA